MGAVRFSIDPRLVRELTRALPLEVFVETGTHEGASTRAMQRYFPEIHTVESSPGLYERAAEGFRGAEGVQVHPGLSEEVLRELAPELRHKAVLYWLDAHWCEGPATPNGESACPLLEELDAIGELNDASVVLIDDARLFLSPPPQPADPRQWPDLGDVLTGIGGLSSQHELMVIDDVIVAFPVTIRQELREWARQNATDWLLELERSRQIDSRLERIGSSLGDARKEIQALRNQARSQAETSRAVREALAEIPEARRDITDLREQVASLQRSVEALRGRPFRKARALIRRIARRIRRRFFSPRLARLEHHPPKQLRVPKRYRRPVPLEDPPRISIVTPSYNQAGFLDRAIRSVLNQQYPELEYIVQDGGSTDGTDDVLARYDGRLHHWEMRPDQGQANAINLGFAHASGEIMAYLNADDLILAGALAYVARYLERHPDVDVVYGHRVLIDDNDKEIGRWVMPRHDDDVLSWVDYVPQETLYWRRRVWAASGGEMDENAQFALDWDLLLRFRDAGARIVRVPRFLGAFRVHPDQKTLAHAETTGKSEVDRIRLREHGRTVSRQEMRRALRGYLWRHVALQKLYRAHLLRY